MLVARSKCSRIESECIQNHCARVQNIVVVRAILICFLPVRQFVHNVVHAMRNNDNVDSLTFVEKKTVIGVLSLDVTVVSRVARIIAFVDSFYSWFQNPFSNQVFK